MVKVTGPAFSLASSPPLRKKRKPYGAAALPAPEPPPPPIPEHVIVTAGDPAPNPDCTGQYNLAGEHDGKSYYQRTVEPTFYLAWDGVIEIWFISITLLPYEPANNWYYEFGPPGTFEPAPAYTGYAIVSEVIPPSP